MKTITLISLALATLLTVLSNAANASDWQDYVAQERNYPNHEEMWHVYERLGQEYGGHTCDCCRKLSKEEEAANSARDRELMDAEIAEENAERARKGK